jgi:hypothetical protein
LRCICRDSDRFCARSTYTLNDSLSSEAEKLFVDIDGGLTTIEALSAQGQGDTSSKPPTVTFARELLADIINKNGAAVLCGGAGSGKSTLLRRFALLAWDAPEKVGLAKRRLPVLVRLRYLAAARGETFEQKIKHALDAANDFIPGRAIPNDFLTSWPEATNVPLLFLFDALDEAASEERGRLLTFLEQLRSRFGDAPIVLSTRDSDLVRNTSFAVVEKTACIAIQQLASTTATSIARALLGAAELQRFLRERDRGRSFVWDTALGVRMAAAVFKSDGKLPHTRGELYELLIRHSFGDEAEGAVQTPAILLNEEGAFHVLGAVASMNLDPSIPSAPSLAACVADALQELRRDLSAVLARGGAREVLNWMRRRGQRLLKQCMPFSRGRSHHPKSGRGTVGPRSSICSSRVRRKRCSWQKYLPKFVLDQLLRSILSWNGYRGCIATLSAILMNRRTAATAMKMSLFVCVAGLIIRR